MNVKNLANEVELAPSFRLLIAACNLGLQILNDFVDVLFPEIFLTGVGKCSLELNQNVTVRLKTQDNSEVWLDLLGRLKLDQPAFTLLGLQLIDTSLLRQE